MHSVRRWTKRTNLPPRAIYSCKLWIM